MEKMIKYLIFALKTVDGKRGSAIPILEKLNAQGIKALQKEQGLKPISSTQYF